jgi:hypothetical protein
MKILNYPLFRAAPGSNISLPMYCIALQTVLEKTVNFNLL